MEDIALGYGLGRPQKEDQTVQLGVKISIFLLKK